MGYRLLIASFLVVILIPVKVQAAQTGDQRGGFVSAGFKRTYLLHIPPGYDGRSKVPLLIVLHGTGAQGADAARITGFSAIADREGFIVVYPDSLVLDKTFRWTVRASEGLYDVAFIQDLIARLEKLYTIDAVYVTGMSNGGYFSYVLACTLPGAFAAMATVIGGMERTVVHHCQSAAPLPLLMINGTADQDVPMVGNTLTLPTNDIRDFWLKVDGCTTDSVSTPLPDTDPNDGTTTTKTAWTHCQSSTRVVQYIIQDGEHAWPGYTSPWLKATCAQQIECPPLDFSASEEIWAFFR